MTLNCEERIETPSALKQIIESGFKEYQKNINKQWNVNSKRFIQTYNNEGMENFFNCSKPKDAPISDGSKLYPASENTNFLS